MNNIVLDMDDGFFFKYPKDSKPQVNAIVSVLQTYFVRWKERNFEGLIFPESMGLNIDSRAEAVMSTPSKVGMFAVMSAPDKKIRIGIDAVNYVDFKEVDPRIEHDGDWMERYPMGTSISVPESCANGIMAKLREHPEITSVNGEITERGREVHAAIERSSCDLTMRVCIACHREFDLSRVDSRIKHDKPWGRRDWDEGASTATSFVIPEDLKDEIIDNLRRHPAVIFAEDSSEMVARRNASSAPSAASAGAGRP